MRKIFERVVPGKQGLAVELEPGQQLRVVDLEGQQVVDMALFNRQNLREKLSTSYSRTRYVPLRGGEYIPRDRLSEGDTLMSTLCRPMLTIFRETAPEKVKAMSRPSSPKIAPSRAPIPARAASPAPSKRRRPIL